MKTHLIIPVATLLTSMACFAVHAAPSNLTFADESRLIPHSADTAADAHRRRGLEGMWDERISVINCETSVPLNSFRATNQFSSGGSMTAVNTTPPFLSGPTLGTWWPISRSGRFGVKMRFFRYNPDGSFAGVQQLSRDIQIDSDGETLTGTVVVEVFDADDNLLQTGCALEEGMRL